MSKTVRPVDSAAVGDPNAPLLQIRDLKMHFPIKGLPPSLLALPDGCSFNPRCPYKDRVKGERCTTELPELLPVDGAGAHTSRCHLHDKASVYEAEVAPRLG